MGIISATKTTDLEILNCEDLLKVTLGLVAAPDIASNPTDIVLTLDRSGSMMGSALENLKLGANEFIDIIEESTDGAEDGQIGGGSRIGIVSFSTTATQDTQLITSVADLKTAVDDLAAGGRTNHADAFTKAVELFDPNSTNAKVLVMFTDGNTTIGADASPIAAAARAQGIIIYVIGLIGTDGINVNALNDWASKPSATYVVVTPDAAKLLEVFENLAKNISKPGATEIEIDELLTAPFEIDSIILPSKGTVVKTGLGSLRWSIEELGATTTEAAILEFYVRDTTGISGLKKVNESVTYSDEEGNVVTFPDPSVYVDCGVPQTEGCPEPVDVAMTGCQDVMVVDLGDTFLQSQGRILQLSVRIRDVCPDRRVALAMIVHEVDENGLEHPRGMKAMTIPAHTNTTCQDLAVNCVKFILPEDLDVSGGTSVAMCNQRNLKVRVLAHYIDTDYACCEVLV